jgi:hypothetical protein
MTPGDIITRALKKTGVLGVGQTASAEDMSDALADLNDMLAQWQRKRWLVYHLVDVVKVSTGAQSYTVGAGGDFDVARPDRIEAAFVRNLNSPTNPADYPLELLEAREDYNRIGVKAMGTVPSCVFYDAAYPLGTLFPWPVPQAATYELHITVKEQLGSFAGLAQTIALPPEYTAALMWNLAAWLRPSYQLPPDPTVAALATASLNTIKNANAQVPRLRMPGDLVRPGRYDAYSDRSR